MSTFWAARYINSGDDSFFSFRLRREKDGNVSERHKILLDRAPQLVTDLFDGGYHDEAFTVLNFLAQESSAHFRETLEYISGYDEIFASVGVSSSNEMYVFRENDDDALTDHEEIEFQLMSLAELSVFGEKFYEGKM